MTQQQTDKQDSPTQSTISTPKGICSPPPLVGDATAIKGKPSALVEPLCECKNWARNGMLPFTEHHANCPKLNLSKESVQLVKRLVKGMEAWGQDCDGIHPEAWEAYKAGKVFVGELDWKEDQTTVSGTPVQAAPSNPPPVDWSKVPRGTIVEVGMGGEYVKGFFLRRSKDGHFAVYFLKPFTGTYTIYPCARLPLPLPENRGQQGSWEAVTPNRESTPSQL